MERAGVTIPEPNRRNPEHLAGFVKSEITKWAGSDQAAGITADRAVAIAPSAEHVEQNCGQYALAARPRVQVCLGVEEHAMSRHTSC